MSCAEISNAFGVTETWADGVGSFEVTQGGIVRIPFYVVRPMAKMLAAYVAMPGDPFMQWLHAAQNQPVKVTPRTRPSALFEAFN